MPSLSRRLKKPLARSFRIAGSSTCVNQMSPICWWMRSLFRTYLLQISRPSLIMALLAVGYDARSSKSSPKRACAAHRTGLP